MRGNDPAKMKKAYGVLLDTGPIKTVADLILCLVNKGETYGL